MSAELLWRAYKVSADRWLLLEARKSNCAAWFVSMRRKKLEQPIDYERLEEVVLASERELARGVRLAKAAAAAADRQSAVTP